MKSGDNIDSTRYINISDIPESFRGRFLHAFGYTTESFGDGKPLISKDVIGFFSTLAELEELREHIGECLCEKQNKVSLSLDVVDGIGLKGLTLNIAPSVKD